MIHRLDGDLNGADSIENVIAEGLMVNHPCHTWDDTDRICRELIYKTKIGKGDTVIFDTIDMIASQLRMENKLGKDLDIELMTKSHKIMEDPNYLNVYQLSGAFIKQRLNNFRARGVQIVIISHEDEEKDAYTKAKKRGPNLNPAFREEVLSFSSDVYRLRKLAENVLVTDGEGNETVAYKRGTRVLQISETDEIIAKYHVKPNEDGSFRDMPSSIVLTDNIKTEWDAIVNVLGKQPSIVTLYGPPGVGKTTLAASRAYSTAHGL